MAATQHEDCVYGSASERVLQDRYGTAARGQAFHRHQVLDHVNETMRAFIARQEMVFIATADGTGAADASFRAGAPGFVRILDDRTLCYPEYRGNGVMASLGNIADSPHIGLLFVDFEVGKIGLHVNGAARLVSNETMAAHPQSTAQVHADMAEVGGRHPERWVVILIEEAYIHCSKHIPRMQKAGDEAIPWGTDDDHAKGGDYFGSKATRLAVAQARAGAGFAPVVLPLAPPPRPTP